MNISYQEIHFEEIDSTSSYLKREYLNLDNFTIVSSDFQSAGRGRNQRHWISEKHANLLFSLLIKDKNLISKYASLSLGSSYAIAKSLEEIGIKNISIKWPNDVYVNGKKICGILLEGMIPEYIVIGIGINVNQKEFDNDLNHPATSIFKELNKEIDINVFKKNVFDNYIEALSLIGKGNKNYLEYIRNHNYLKGKIVNASINDKIEEIEVIDINDDNTLKVKCHNEIINLQSGEITFHI